MSAIKKFVKAFHALGLVAKPIVTLEDELFEIGRELERRHREKTSIHDGGFGLRFLAAKSWAGASGFSVQSINHYFELGAKSLRGK